MHFGQDPTILKQVMASVARDVRRASTPGELEARLARKGFAVQPGETGPVVVTAPHGVVLGPLPAR